MLCFHAIELLISVVLFSQRLMRQPPVIRTTVRPINEPSRSLRAAALPPRPPSYPGNAGRFPVPDYDMAQIPVSPPPSYDEAQHHPVLTYTTPHRAHPTEPPPIESM